VLGEGVRWDALRGELLRVDIIAGRVFVDYIEGDGDLIPLHVYEVPGTVGAVSPIDGDDGWLLAAGQDIVHLHRDGSRHSIAEVAAPGTRMNDAACDPGGRFWAGTLADDHHEGGGALYRLDGEGSWEQVLNGLTISNGLGWSSDGRTMYLVDSGPRVIYRFAFEPESGELSDRQVIVTVGEEVGAPDGMTVDANGDLWVAIYGGGCVHHYSPDGRLLDVLDVPASQSTCCAFGGPGMGRLYVTTATEGWSDEQRRAEPAAGLVYRFDTEVAGRPVQPFRPDPDWWAQFEG